MPAFSLVEPATTSCFVSKVIQKSAFFNINPFGLLLIASVWILFSMAKFKTSFVNGVFPLAAKQIRKSSVLIFFF